MQSTHKITSATVELRMEIRGKTSVIPVQIGLIGRPDVTVYLGFGNEGAAIKRTLGLLAGEGLTDVAVVGALPYWRIPSDKAGLEALAVQAVLKTSDYMVKTYKLRPGYLSAVAESQASPALVYAALQYPNLFRRVALVRPMGLVRLNKRSFAKRMLAATIQPEQLFDWRSVPIGVRAARRTIQSSVRAGGQLDAALEVDILQPIRQLRQSRPADVHVFAAARDRLFPVGQLEQSLGSDVPVEVIDGSHSSPATKAGARQIKHAILWCRGKS